jgi:hypothetical protein
MDLHEYATKYKINIFIGSTRILGKAWRPNKENIGIFLHSSKNMIPLVSIL